MVSGVISAGCAVLTTLTVVALEMPSSRRLEQSESRIAAGMAFHCGERGGGGVLDDTQPMISITSATGHARRRVAQCSPRLGRGLARAAWVATAEAVATEFVVAAS